MPSFEQFLSSFDYQGAPLGGGAGRTSLTSQFGEYEDLYGSVLSGSREAGAQLRQGLERAFESRRAGIAGGYQRYEQGLLNELNTTGLNDTMARRMLAEMEQVPLSQIASARAQSESELGMGLSELAKGTGTELAGLSFQTKGLEQQRWIATKMIEEMRKARRSGLIGDILGGAMNIGANFLLPGSGALTGLLSQGGGGGSYDFGDPGGWPGFTASRY